MATKGKSKGSKKSLKQTKQLDSKKMLIVVLFVAVVGGLFMLVSNAGAESSYNTSVSACPKSPADKLKSCVDKSAESLVYRYYLGLLGRKPDTGGITFWSKQLTSKKNTPVRVAERMLASNESKNKEVPNIVFVSMLYANISKTTQYDNAEFDAYLAKLNAKKVTREQLIKEFATNNKISVETATTAMSIDDAKFVTNLYERMLGRKWVSKNTKAAKTQNKEVQYWVNKLKRQANGTKPSLMTRPQVAFTFAKSNEATKKLSQPFIDYVNSLK